MTNSLALNFCNHRPVYTYTCQVDMADQLHDTRNLIGGHDASPFAFRDNLIWHLILLRFEDRGLVQTYS